MPVLYLANCTRLDFDKYGEKDPRAMGKLPKHQDIPAGRQVPLGGELHMTQIEDIIQQLQPYGLMAQKDIASEHGRLSWVFNVNRPVSEDAIRYVLDFNSGILTEEGQKRRHRAAIAANEALAEQIEGEPDRFHVEFEQLDEEGRKGPLLAEGVRVDKNAPGPSAKAKTRKPPMPRSLRAKA